MDNKQMLKQAQELRESAERLESNAKRLLPEKWAVGQKVRFLRDKEWCCSKGDLAVVVAIEVNNRKGISADEYQVFFTSPIDDRGKTWWTTPDEVELIEE